MDKVVISLLLLGTAVTMVHACPKYCVCQNLSESLGTLCPSKGLLFVPLDIDRRTVELRLGGNFILKVTTQDFANMSGLVDLTLSRNTISTIQPFSFIDLETLRSLFGGNPLHCNCEVLWLRRLEREDDMETCASPANLKGRYFWSVREEEFVCEPPLITQHTHKLLVLEGQTASLRCKAVGDPMPSVHWVAPDDRLISNSSRATVYENGTLDITITTSKDYGTFTCIAANAAGESTASIELSIIQLPHLSNGTNRTTQSKSGLSDITSSTKISKGETKALPEKAVSVSEVTAISVLIKWTVSKATSKVKMYQLQYNCSEDEVLIYRMIPVNNRAFVVTNLTNGGLNRFNGAPPQVKSTVVVMREEMVEFKCGSLQSSLSSSSSSSNSLDSQTGRGTGDRYSIQGSECSTLPSSKFRRHGAKARPNLDHLLGAFTSLELRGVARDHQGASGPSTTPTTMMTVALAPLSDKEPLLGRAESTTMLGRLLGMPQEGKPKRSHSFDMGHVGAMQCRGNYPRRISNIWTKRSLSVNGMLLQYDESEDEKPPFESSEWVMESTV
ncbi:leucine-rich repeat and fibronectin type-III domain-containing protein 2 [Scomber scombrus]|uniref:Leucine-rich repeat and fibronectin type-III domain-containing protein 2 n=1 Tax=Scomber scombrus TaxID=13677 RepID=A0AAV1NSY1_SCOSC